MLTSYVGHNGDGESAEFFPSTVVEVHLFFHSFGSNVILQTEREINLQEG